jgi:hypothetical protein
MRLGLALVLVACAGRAQPIEEPRSVDADHVRVSADATVGDVLNELRDVLAARGHHAGECFLAWDYPARDAITVHIGDHARRAAVTCGNLAAFDELLEGRCVFLRFYWLSGEALHTDAMSLYFAPPGRAYAARPLGGSGIAAPAREAFLREDVAGARTILGISLERREETSDQRSPSAGMTPERPNPLVAPETAEAVRQLVERIQECNPVGNGSLVLEWRVEPDGDIVDAEAFSASVSESAAECALEVLTNASFPEHGDAEPIDYCVPVLLDPRLRPAQAEGEGGEP